MHVVVQLACPAPLGPATNVKVGAHLSSPHVAVGWSGGLRVPSQQLKHRV